MSPAGLLLYVLSLYSFVFQPAPPPARCAWVSGRPSESAWDCLSGSDPFLGLRRAPASATVPVANAGDVAVLASADGSFLHILTSIQKNIAALTASVTAFGKRIDTSEARLGPPPPDPSPSVALVDAP